MGLLWTAGERCGVVGGGVASRWLEVRCGGRIERGMCDALLAQLSNTPQAHYCVVADLCIAALAPPFTLCTLYLWQAAGPACHLHGACGRHQLHAVWRADPAHTHSHLHCGTAAAADSRWWWCRGAAAHSRSCADGEHNGRRRSAKQPVHRDLRRSRLSLRVG